MNKKNVVFFILVVAIALIGLLIVGLYKDNEDLKQVEAIVDYVLASEEPVMLYLSSTECENCEITTNQLGMMMDYYDFEFYYLDVVEISADSDKDRIFTKLGLDVYEGVTTPSILIYSNGKLIESIIDISGVNSIFDALVNQNIITKDTEAHIEYLNSTTINELGKDYIMGLTSYTYGDCYEFDKIIWEIEEEYNLDIKMLYAEDLSEEEGDTYLEKIEYPNIDTMGFPTLYIVKNGKVVDAFEGLNTFDDYIEFFQKNDIID